MLAGSDRDWNIVLADQVVGHAYVVEIVHLEHDVVEPAVATRNSESNRVIAVVAMHEDEPNSALAAAKFVLDTAAHSEVSIEALGRIDVALAHDAVTQAARAGLETSMHRAARMERLTELHQRAVKDLDWIAVGVVELEDFEHATLVSFVLGTDTKLYP